MLFNNVIQQCNCLSAAVLGDGTHSHSIVTQEPCTLLRVKRTDFQDLWNHKSHLMQEIVANCYDSKAAQVAKQHDSASRKSSADNNINNHNNSVDNCSNVGFFETNFADNVSHESLL